MSAIQPPTPSVPEGEVYTLAKQDERPLTVYVKNRLTGGHDWYRIPSWPVVFLGFEEFDLRVHRTLEGTGWAISEATSGMNVVQAADAHESATPCESVAWLISQEKMTIEKLRDGIAKAKVRLVELGLTPNSESAPPTDPAVLEALCHDERMPACKAYLDRGLRCPACPVHSEIAAERPLLGAVRRLVDQIRKGKLVDDHGHDFTMNAEFIVVEALMGMAPRALDVIRDLPIAGVLNVDDPADKRNREWGEQPPDKRLPEPDAPTPRTDEEVEIAKKFPFTQHGLWVATEFARHLERELAEERDRRVNAELDRDAHKHRPVSAIGLTSNLAGTTTVHPPQSSARLIPEVSPELAARMDRWVEATHGKSETPYDDPAFIAVNAVEEGLARSAERRTIQRYTFERAGDSFQFTTTVDGPWVKVEDVAQLQVELGAAMDRCDEALNAAEEAVRQRDAAIAPLSSEGVASAPTADESRDAFIARGYWPNEVLWKVWEQACEWRGAWRPRS